MEKHLNWDEILKRVMNPVFDKGQFEKYLKRHKEKLSFYKKWVPGNRILEIGCGFGYTAIPLSALGYNITALDDNLEVINVIKKNAENFGGNVKIIKGDIFDIDKLFGKDTFDASISGGLLEHFDKTDIKKILDKQLAIAPVVIADIPIHSDKSTLKERYSDFNKKICKDGVFRNLWDKEYWVKTILKGYNIAYAEVSTSSSNTGSFEKLTLVIKRKSLKIPST